MTRNPRPQKVDKTVDKPGKAENGKVRQPKWWEDMGRLYAGEQWCMVYDIPAILAEHTKRICAELEGMKRKSAYSVTGECEICGGDYLQNCVCDSVNVALGEAIKRVKEL